MGKRTDVLGDRMKKNYDGTSRYFLTRCIPAVIRVDGKNIDSEIPTFTQNREFVERRLRA